jgi:hypothetical protein
MFISLPEDEDRTCPRKPKTVGKVQEANINHTAQFAKRKLTVKENVYVWDLISKMYTKCKCVLI